MPFSKLLILRAVNDALLDTYQLKSLDGQIGKLVGLVLLNTFYAKLFAF